MRADRDLPDDAVVHLTVDGTEHDFAVSDGERTRRDVAWVVDSPIPPGADWQATVALGGFTGQVLG